MHMQSNRGTCGYACKLCLAPTKPGLGHYSSNTTGQEHKVIMERLHCAVLDQTHGVHIRIT